MEQMELDKIHKSNNGDTVIGVVLVSDYSRRVAKNKQPFIDGTFMVKGGSVPFKIWQGSDCESFIQYDYSNVIIKLTATVAVFNNAKYLEVRSTEVTDEYTVEHFLDTVYDVDMYSKALEDLVKSNVSEKGLSVINEILFSNKSNSLVNGGWEDKNIYDRFKVEFAGKTMHDACKSGLLGHTYKVLYFLISTLSLFPNMLMERDDLGELTPSQDRKDLLVLGAVLHDIGKTMELNFGVYQENSSVTHRLLGMEFLVQFRDLIISTYNEKWYYELISIVVQHHHIYDEKARTLPAYIIHLVDMFESGATALSDKILEGGDIKSSGEVLKLNRDTHLHI